MAKAKPVPTPRVKKEKVLKIEQLDSISVQGSQVEDKVRELVDYINENC